MPVPYVPFLILLCWNSIVQILSNWIELIMHVALRTSSKTFSGLYWCVVNLISRTFNHPYQTNNIDSFRYFSLFIFHFCFQSQKRYFYKIWIEVCQGLFDITSMCWDNCSCQLIFLFIFRENGVICTLSPYVIWCVVLIPVAAPLFDRETWNKKKEM